MNTAPLQLEEFASSVLAVPPLARSADLSINTQQNQRLIRHIESGGIKTLLYGGNANLYHCSLHDYGQLLGLLAQSSAPTTRVIPSIGPDFGKMMDQARLLRGTEYRTAMVLPMLGFTTARGVADAIARFVDFTGIPVTLYLKDDNTITVEGLGALVEEGRIVAVKYAVVREDPLDDTYLHALIGRIGAARIVSGMGERPAIVHLAHFGLASFTTGSGCIAPGSAMRLLAALKGRDVATAKAIHARFMPMEDLRESISLIRVLHDAVTLSGIADMGTQLPMLSPSPAERLDEIKAHADALLAWDRDWSAQA